MSLRHPTPTTREIIDAWNMFEDMDPEISTERLFAMVCDHFEGAVDDCDIAAAIAEDEAARA